VHAATFWGFIILIFTIIEAYGDLFSRTFAILGIGHSPVLGFLEDLFSIGVLAGIIAFAVIRLRDDPQREGRKSRFFGSHTRGRSNAVRIHQLSCPRAVAGPET
jgi:hypothetical protein